MSATERPGAITARVCEVFVAYVTKGVHTRAVERGGVYAREEAAHEAVKSPYGPSCDGMVVRRKALVTEDGQVWLLDAQTPLLVLNTAAPPDEQTTKR